MSRSENGWEPLHAGEDILNWIDVPGTNPTVRLRLMKGWPTQILRAFAADFNAYVEPLRDGDSGGFTPTNSVATSNHLNGTAMDLNWNGEDGKTFRLGISKERAYPGDKARKLDELIDFYERTVFCGGEWSIRDWMHMQMGGNTWMNPKTQDFINRKIRADGFSTYKRGGSTPAPLPAPATNAADVLARATGVSIGRAVELLPRVSFALVKSNCNNPRRIAAALAQWVIESGHFKYTEEIASGPESEERWKYKGRTWIQLTWLENYRGFSEWCHSIGLVPSPTEFVDNPKSLADQKWAALGPAYWWAVKYPQINEYADRGDIDNVSKWVNAPAWVGNPNKHANGEKERRDAYNKALALGDQLLSLVSASPPAKEGFLMALSDQQQQEIYDFICGHRPSESLLRPLGQGNIGNMRDVIGYLDGTVNWIAVRMAAHLGHPKYVKLLEDLAEADLAQYPDREEGKMLAEAILAEMDSQAGTCPPAPAQLGAADAFHAATQLVEPQVVEKIVYRDPPEPKVVFLPAPRAEVSSEPAHAAKSAGELIGNAYTALKELNLADALPIEDRAPLAALISVLQTKNGSQL